MKLCCSKCKKLLTSDLYPVKLRFTKHGGIDKRDIRKAYNRSYDGYDYSRLSMKSGLFYVEKSKPKYNHTYKDAYGVEGKSEAFEIYGEIPHLHVVVKSTPEYIVVGRPSILENIIPKYKTGVGCCDYSMGWWLVCECGSKLGEMYLDCYETNKVKFYSKKVDRVYK